MNLRKAYIRGEVSITSLNKLIQELRQKGDCELWLPTNLHYRSPLSLAQLFQALITWSRQGDPQACLRCYAENKKGETEFMDRFHGLIAALLGRRIKDREGNDLTNELLHLARDRLQWHASIGRQLAFVLDTLSDHRDLARKVLGVTVPSRGEKVLFLCADEYQEPSDIAMLYGRKDGNWKPRPSPHFVTLLRKAFESGRIGMDLKQAEIGKSRLLEHIAIALAELFKNTDDWAKVSVRGAVVPHSCRGILIESLGGTGSLESRYSEEQDEKDPLTDFLRGRFSTKSGVRWVAVGISVFDSGDGLAQRWLGRPIESDVTVQDELAAVLSCLRLHGTTSERAERGIGLHQVMASLSEEDVRGFMYLRTGRLCLYRNLGSDPLAPSLPGKPDPYWLKDWTLREANTARDAGRVEGTLLSFVFMVPLIPSSS